MGSHGSTDVSKATADKNNHPFFKAIANVSTLCGWAAAFMLVAAVAITCEMIYVRFVLNGSTTWQTECVIYLVIASTLIGLPYVQLLRGHVNVDLIPLLLGPRARYCLAIVTLSLSSLMIAIMLYFGIEYWHIAYSKGWKSDTIWGVSLWIPYLSIPIGLGVFLMQLLSDLLAVILKIEAPFGLEDE